MSFGFLPPWSPRRDSTSQLSCLRLPKRPGRGFSVYCKVTRCGGREGGVRGDKVEDGATSACSALTVLWLLWFQLPKPSLSSCGRFWSRRSSTPSDSHWRRVRSRMSPASCGQTICTTQLQRTHTTSCYGTQHTHRLLREPIYVVRDGHPLENVLGAMLLEGVKHHSIALGREILRLRSADKPGVRWKLGRGLKLLRDLHSQSCNSPPPWHGRFCFFRLDSENLSPTATVERSVVLGQMRLIKYTTRLPNTTRFPSQ